MPSTPPPSYSAALQDDIIKQPIEYPYSRKIELYCASVFSIFPIGLCFAVLFIILTRKNCTPTERLEPCEFSGKLSFDKIFSMKKEINEIHRKSDEITNVMNYGLPIESSQTLIQKQNAINETLQKLLEKFNYQRIHLEKCYFENSKNSLNIHIIFNITWVVTLSLIALFCFVKAYYYIKQVPVSELNEEQLASYNGTYTAIGCCFVLLILIICGILSLFFMQTFKNFEEIDMNCLKRLLKFE